MRPDAGDQEPGSRAAAPGAIRCRCASWGRPSIPRIALIVNPMRKCVPNATDMWTAGEIGAADSLSAPAYGR